MFDIEIYRLPLGGFTLQYNEKAMGIVKDPLYELWEIEQLQRARLFAATNGLRCSGNGSTDTLEELLEERGLMVAVDMIKSTQPKKLDLIVDDLPSAVINLDWSSNKRAFEELFFAVGGCYGED